jgi:hypothetical protein
MIHIQKTGNKMNEENIKNNALLWKMELTEEQFYCIIRGMEYYHRMMCGQVDVVDDVCEEKIDLNLQNELKKQMFPNLMIDESYGWNGTDKSSFGDEMAISYQIYREMKHKDAIERKIDNVYSSETLHSNKAVALKIERINK